MIPVADLKTADEVRAYAAAARARMRQYAPVRTVVATVRLDVDSGPPCPEPEPAPPPVPRIDPVPILIAVSDEEMARPAQIIIRFPECPTASFIQRRVGRFYGVHVDAITGPSQSKPIVQARHMAMFLCREIQKLSLPEIGALFGRDHTSVLHAVRAVAKLERTNATTVEELGYLRAAIQDEWATLVIRAGMAASAANECEAEA